MRSRVLLVLAGLAAVVAGLVAAAGVPAASSQSQATTSAGSGSVVLFAADGLRQDLVQSYADQKLLPTFAKLLKNGAQAPGGGLLTQSPPNTGAGWYTLATGAWPGVHGSTNNTFHINGQPFGNRTAAFDTGVLQAETIAQSAERGGKKVAQVEWAGGRVGEINGPTVHFRAFFSGRGVATNYIAPTDDPVFTASFGLQLRERGSSTCDSWRAVAAAVTPLCPICSNSCVGGASRTSTLGQRTASLRELLRWRARTRAISSPD